MSKEKLLKTTVRGENAKRLQQLLLDYHNHRQQLLKHPLRDQLDALGDWQAARLKQTHQDLYHHPRFHPALDFLLKDLYAPKEFTRRDDDIERIFPTMVKLLPDHALYVVAALVELNLLSQRLDLALAEVLFAQASSETINEARYIEAYRRCDNQAARLHQIQLIANIGDDLAQYVNSRLLSFTLRMTEKPADMAGLGELHGFLSRGFKAFRLMGEVAPLLSCIVRREMGILERIFAGTADPFALRGAELDSPAA